LSKDGKKFVGEKKNVTDLFHKVLIDMYSGYEVVIEGKGKRWKVKVEEIKE
jgi:IS4 transposase